MTYAPIPSLVDIWNVIRLRFKNDNELAQPWLLNAKYFWWTSRSTWSFVVLAAIKSVITGNQSQSVWVPDYFCNSALHLLRKFGCRFVFYPLTDSLAPDIERCIEIAKVNKVDIFLLVHYFGGSTPGNEAVIFCKERNAWLVEDGAHALNPVGDIGTIGDFVLYSPHKHFAIPDGALTIINEFGPSALNGDIIQSEILPLALELIKKISKNQLFFYLVWTIKRMIQGIGFRVYASPTNFADDEASNYVSPGPEMGRLSKCLLSVQLKRLDEIRNARIQNDRAWKNIARWLFANDSGRELHSGLHSSPAIEFPPYLSGFEFHRGIVENIFINLQQAKFPVSSWPDLPPEVVENKEKHESALRLRQSRIYLANHQSIKLNSLFSHVFDFIGINKAWHCKEIDFIEWSDLWSNVDGVNLLQSWGYGDAKQKCSTTFTVERWLISDSNGQAIALFQLHKLKVPLLGFFVVINRGPLLVESKLQNKNHMQDKSLLHMFVLYYLSKFGKTLGWASIYCIPEIAGNKNSLNALGQLGFIRIGCRVPWGSAKINLLVSDDQLMAHITSRWRNALRKSYQNDVSVNHIPTSIKAIDLLIEEYSKFQALRNFQGLSQEMIKAIAEVSILDKSFSFNIFEAKDKNGNMLGWLATITSGDTATYLLACVNTLGRDLQANSALLWRAINEAKALGCHFFDLGGLDWDMHPTIAKFKAGLNPTPYKLSGEWFKIL